VPRSERRSRRCQLGASDCLHLGQPDVARPDVDEEEPVPTHGQRPVVVDSRCCLLSTGLDGDLHWRTSMVAPRKYPEELR